MISGPELRLRNILDDLMGPSHCTSVSEKWNETILVNIKYSIFNMDFV